MRDIDGNEVSIGDIVRVLRIREDIPLADDEKPMVYSMLNNDYAIEEFVNDETQISISHSLETDEGIMWGGLYLSPNEFRLIEKSAK